MHNYSRGKSGAIVQVRNEEAGIENVMRQLLRARLDYCVIVANGCSDRTVPLAQGYFSSKKLSGQVVSISEPLGPDVGKAIGAIVALRQHMPVEQFVFIDGDWLGSFGPSLQDLLRKTADGDSDIVYTSRQATPVSNRHEVRPDLELWQRALGQHDKSLQYAAVSELPMVVKQSVFTTVSALWLYHPGFWLVHCLRASRPLRISTDSAFSTAFLGNPVRTALHQQKMSDTLIGDAVEGTSLLLGRKPNRWWQGKERDGYHSSRRVDLLLHWLSSTNLSGLCVPVSDL